MNSKSDAILARLTSLHPKLIDLSLDRIFRLLDKLGNPQDRLPPVVHVAGTNGKGSTVAYMRSCLEAAGYSVHVYTSPHLVRFHERIRLAGKLVSEQKLSETLEEVEKKNEQAPITIFEITTAAAFLLFSQVKADILLLETGLGGKLDATNVVTRPLLTVITSIGLDHQSYLGDTVELIAAEKAGIMREHVPCILGTMHSAARDQIRLRAASLHAPLFIQGEDWDCYFHAGRLNFQRGEELLDLPIPRLIGNHQLMNAGLAVASLLQLKDFEISSREMEEGILNAQWPARMQPIVQGKVHELAPANAELWLDGGHNPDAGEALALTLAQLEERDPKPLILICGMLNTKDNEGFLRPFGGLARWVFCVEIPGAEASLDAEELLQAALSVGLHASVAESVSDALEQASSLLNALDYLESDECNEKDDLFIELSDDGQLDEKFISRFADETPIEAPRILICGSLYLAGHVLAQNGNTIK